MSQLAILTDVTKCIGCAACVDACKRTNGTGGDAPYRWERDPEDVSSHRWTTLVRTHGRSVRLQCRHCLDPSCAAACPVGALHRSESGAVVYDASICMGCRYCMVACPFGLTRYEWESPTPRVRKCILCYDRIRSGELEQPACTAACPEGATVFGERDALLREAQDRIRRHPGRYLPHVWGENEVGGTSVLYLSDVPLDSAGWPDDLGDRARPPQARRVLHTVPYTFGGVVAVMGAIHWSLRRREEVAAVEGCDTDEGGGS